MLGVPLENLKVTRGRATLSLYEWNTRVAKHYFCSVCGVYTHHQRRSDPNEYAVNVACLNIPSDLLSEDIEFLNGGANSLVGD